MARVNINILGISELKWSGIGDFSSDDHYIYYCGQESLRRNGVALTVNKSLNAVLECNFKNDRIICLFPRQTIQYHNNPSLCPNQECWRNWNWTALWRPTRPSRTNTQKRCPFHYKGLECKSRKSRDTESNRRIWPCSTKWSRSKGNRVLPRERTDHSKLSLPTTQEMTRTSLDGQHRNQTDYILCSQRWRSSIQSAKTRPGVDCGSDHELLIAKFRLKVKKVGKTTRPFRYDLNQIAYNYTVEVTKRFKGSELIESLTNNGQRFLILYKR